MCALHTDLGYLSTKNGGGKRESVNFTHMTSHLNQELSQLVFERYTWLTSSVGYLHIMDVCDETVSDSVYARLLKITSPADRSG